MAAAFDRSGRQISAICLPASRWNDVSLPDSAGAAEAVLFRTDDSFRPLCAPEKIIFVNNCFQEDEFMNPKQRTFLKVFYLKAFQEELWQIG